MRLGLEKELERFYEEMDNEESWNLGEMACDLVPTLEYEIRTLEKRIEELTSEKVGDDK